VCIPLLRARGRICAIRQSQGEFRSCEWNKHAQDRHRQSGVLLVWPNVARKQEKGETVTDKEIRSGEAAMAQKQADEALRENERQFRALFEQAAIGVAKVETATGQFVLVNQRYADIVGYSREELLSLDFQTITYPDDRLTDSLNMKRLASGQVREFTTEKRYRRKDGTQVWANLTVSALWNPGEPATYHMAMIVDITERKRVEEAEALRESEERYRTIYDQSPIAIELYDAAGTLVHANPAGLNLFGIKDVQAIRGFPLFADPNIDDEQKEKLHQGEAVRYQGPLDFERVKTLNLYPTTREGIIWLDVLITPLGNRADSISGFLMQVQDITEHKQAEEALRENEALYQSLVKVSPLSICRKDLAGRFTFANQRFLEALNLSLADLIGLTDFDLHPPELAEKYRRDDRAVMDSGQAREFIEERAVLGGESRVIQSYKTPIYDGAGKINGVQISFWDITERKQAEEAQQKSEAQYRLLADNSTDVIWTLDLNGVFTYVSPSVFQLRGYTPEEAIRQPLYEVLSKGSIAIVQEKIQQSLEKAKSGAVPAPSVTEVEQPCKDGSSVWTEVVSRLMFDATGKPVGIMGVSRNITERKQADEETQRERAYFDRFVETTPEGIAICDAQGRVMRVNAEFVRMFGYGVDEAVGQCIDDLVAPPGRQEEARAITRSTGQGEKNLLETVRRRKDGTLVDVSLIAAPVLITGKQEAIYSIYRDITERKQAEEARKKAEAQLRQSQKMEAIGTLAGGIAHDFNNLLTGILGNAAIMRSSLPPADPLLENLNAVETAARRAADLTKGLLTFGRSAAILPVALDVDAAVGETLDLLHQSLPATINIVRDFQPDAWNILADRSQLTQILLNLAVNARDAMEGKGTLTFSVRNEVVDELYVRQYPYAQTGEYVRLSVNDTGPGIPDEIMEHLFEPFHTTKPVGSGTGLGLSVIYGAVKQSGGWITTTTGHDTGTTFNIFLPRCVSPAVPVQTPRPIVENIQHSTVLVVEDEPVVRTVTQSLLTRSGYLVMTAGNGAEALDMIAQHRKEIDLIMLDMTMPGMTTGEIVRAIRALDPTVPILLNSGFASNKTAKQILEEDSVQGFLAKPYDLHQLLEKVQSLLCRG
jgi:two-component system cell cycle sensor histidine kinase/response regulator CckA